MACRRFDNCNDCNETVDIEADIAKSHAIHGQSVAVTSVEERGNGVTDGGSDTDDRAHEKEDVYHLVVIILGQPVRILLIQHNTAALCCMLHDHRIRGTRTVHQGHHRANHGVESEEGVLDNSSVGESDSEHELVWVKRDMESDVDDPPEQMDAPGPGGNPFDGNEREMTLEA
mmetsp:Transcript_17927/g.39094  ORF Transcript_17927/g.39094 Transcript_17927/m.39094 type:complete len:173 (+) Transcript_17927:686-1204(+)